jgi:hypothetical protein
MYVHWKRQFAMKVISAVVLPTTYRPLAILGLILYGVSWVTPSLDGMHIGAWAFCKAPTVGLELTAHSRSPMGILAGLALLCGWLANFSILFRWPIGARPLWMVAPWIPFVVLLVQHGPAPSPVPLLYFYPWAVGITLIHLAGVADTWPVPVP